MDSSLSLLSPRGVKRRVARGLCRKCRKTRLRYPSPRSLPYSLLRSRVSSIFLVYRNYRFCGLVQKKLPQSLRVSCEGGLEGEWCSFLKSCRRSWAEGESVLSSRMLARELLCFLVVLPSPPLLALRRNLSPRDLVDLTDLLSLQSTLSASPAPSSSLFPSPLPSLPCLPLIISTPPPISLNRSMGDRLTSTGSVSKCSTGCFRSEAALGISMEGNLGVERAEGGYSCLSPNENWKPYLRVLIGFINITIPPSHGGVALYNKLMRGKGREGSGKEGGGRMGWTAGFGGGERGFGQGLGFRPFATVHLRGGQERGGVGAVGNPFTRIGRVERMIRQQREEREELPLEEWTAGSHSLKPQFKVRTSKRPLRRDRQDGLSPQLHLQNLTLQCSPRSQSQSLPEQRLIPFQQTLKNRRRLHLRQSRAPHEASLLDRLNRISEGGAVRRYRQRALLQSKGD